MNPRRRRHVFDHTRRGIGDHSWFIFIGSDYFPILTDITLHHLHFDDIVSTALARSRHKSQAPNQCAVRDWLICLQWTLTTVDMGQMIFLPGLFHCPQTYLGLILATPGFDQETEHEIQATAVALSGLYHSLAAVQVCFSCSFSRHSCFKWKHSV